MSDDVSDAPFLDDDRLRMHERRRDELHQEILGLKADLSFADETLYLLERHKLNLGPAYAAASGWHDELMADMQVKLNELEAETHTVESVYKQRALDRAYAQPNPA